MKRLTIYRYFFKIKIYYVIIVIIKKEKNFFWTIHSFFNFVFKHKYISYIYYHYIIDLIEFIYTFLIVQSLTMEKKITQKKKYLKIIKKIIKNQLLIG